MNASVQAYTHVCRYVWQIKQSNNKQMLWQYIELKAFSLHANILNLPNQIKFSIVYCDLF